MDIEKVVKETWDELVYSIKWEFDSYINKCESPIEKLFTLAVLQEKIDGNFRTVGHVIGDRYLIIQSFTCQKPIGKYRADFVINFRKHDRVVSVAVECDGHDYHEKTKEQAKRDKAKDRFLQQQGYLVARFTGSEIYEDANDCLWQVIELASAAINR